MLAKAQRLRRSREVARLLKRGQAVSNQFFTLKFLFQPAQPSQATVIISTKVAKKAVRRNRLRRQLQAALQKNWSQLKPGVALVIIAKAESLTLNDFWQLNQVVRELMRQAHLLC